MKSRSVKLLFDVMVYKRIFLEFVFLTLITIPSFPQVNTRNVIHHDELNGNNIFHVYSDSHGYVWMATHNGLLRFDGYEFKQF
jgi:hypothetical protein